MTFLIKEKEFASYDHTPYVTAETLENVMKMLEKDSTNLFQWFLDNQCQANIQKRHLFVFKTFLLQWGQVKQILAKVAAKN